METYQLYNFTPPVEGVHFSNPSPDNFFENVSYNFALNNSNEQVQKILKSFPIRFNRHQALVTIGHSEDKWIIPNIDPFDSSRDETVHLWSEEGIQIPYEKFVLDLTDVHNEEEFLNRIPNMHVRELQRNSMVICNRYQLCKPKKDSLFIMVKEIDNVLPLNKSI